MDHKNDCPIYHGGQCQTPVACASQPESLGASGAQPVTVKPPADVPMSAFYMSLRDYFAAAALTGMRLPSNYSDGPDNKLAADRAYALADAMLATR